ncbi:MAG: hypothetical protein AAF335_04580 [Bacteroidota bacterium]
MSSLPTLLSLTVALLAQTSYLSTQSVGNTYKCTKKEIIRYREILHCATMTPEAFEEKSNSNNSTFVLEKFDVCLPNQQNTTNPLPCLLLQKQTPYKIWLKIRKMASSIKEDLKNNKDLLSKLIVSMNKEVVGSLNRKYISVLEDLVAEEIFKVEDLIEFRLYFPPMPWREVVEIVLQIGLLPPEKVIKQAFVQEECFLENFVKDLIEPKKEQEHERGLLKQLIEKKILGDASQQGAKYLLQDLGIKDKNQQCIKTWETLSKELHNYSFKDTLNSFRKIQVTDLLYEKGLISKALFLSQLNDYFNYLATYIQESPYHKKNYIKNSHYFLSLTQRLPSLQEDIYQIALSHKAWYLAQKLLEHFPIIPTTNKEKVEEEIRQFNTRYNLQQCDVLNMYAMWDESKKQVAFLKIQYGPAHENVERELKAIEEHNWLRKRKILLQDYKKNKHTHMLLRRVAPFDIRAIELSLQAILCNEGIMQTRMYSNMPELMVESYLHDAEKENRLHQIFPQEITLLIIQYYNLLLAPKGMHRDFQKIITHLKFDPTLRTKVISRFKIKTANLKCQANRLFLRLGFIKEKKERETIIKNVFFTLLNEKETFPTQKDIVFLEDLYPLIENHMSKILDIMALTKHQNFFSYMLEKDNTFFLNHYQHIDKILKSRFCQMIDKQFLYNPTLETLLEQDEDFKAWFQKEIQSYPR